MSQESTTPDLVELVRGVFDALNRRDFDALSHLYSPEVVYRPQPSFTDTQERRGRDELRRFVAGYFEAWADDFTYHPETVRVYGDAVIARVSFTGHARVSGVEVSGRLFNVFQFHDGLVTRIEDFVDREDALKAVGLADG